MPIEIGIWKLGDKLQRVKPVSMDTESRLEKFLAEDLSILSPDWMLIGRQVGTNQGKFIDLLAMDAEGNLVVIELKRDRTPREVAAQVLDYASWVQTLTYERIAEIYAEKNGGQELEKGFDEAFGTSPPEKLNGSHQLVIVAAQLDPATERIINYLSDNYGVPINAVFFQYFKSDGSEFLTRTWLIDPLTVIEGGGTTKGPGAKETWNGRDFYVNFGDSSAEGEGYYRVWEDARRFGFVSAGGGNYYAKPLERLFPGARVFACIPKRGYAGVGTVVESAVPATEFEVEHDGRKVPYLDLPPKLPGLERLIAEKNDPKTVEMMVRVKWLKTVPKDKAYWEKGLFANPLPACRLRNRFTLERLARHFGLDD